MSIVSPSTPMPRAITQLKFDNTLGALLIGGLIGMALWAITSVQTYNYFTHIKNRDRPPFKVMVAVLWTLDTVDSCLSGHTLYFYLVTNYGNILALFKPTWSLIFRIVLTSITNFTIRSLFAHRVYRLSKGNIFLTGWIVLISSAQFAIGIVLTLRALGKSFSQGSELKSLFYALFCVGTTSDLSITAILAYLLYTSRTGYTKTDTVIKILMAYTVNTGFVVAIDATISMVAYITMPQNFIFIAFYLLNSKLFLNSYLTTLNAREVLRHKAEASFQISGGNSSARRDLEDNLVTRTSYMDMKPQHTTGQSISMSQPVELSIFPYSGQLKG